MDTQDLAIDPHKLEEEWLNQPLLYERAADEMSNELRQRNEAKTNLETLIAETASDIRANPYRYGLEKVTESAVQETIAKNEHVVQAKKLLNTFLYSYQKASGWVEAVEMKKKALENLVQLYKGQYFSVPGEGHEIEGGKRFQEQVKENIKKEHREIMAEKKKNRKLGKFSDPVTTPEERAEVSDEEKLAKMTPETRKQVEEIEKNKQGPKPGKESPRRRRRR